MTWKKARKNDKPAMGGTALAAAAVLFFSVLFFYFGAAGTWDMSWSDRLNQKASVTNKKIYIIAIDDKTLERYGPVSAWSRAVPAELIEKLNADKGAGPAVIGLDVIYSERGDEEGDLRFAEACREAGNVVAAQSFVFREMPERDENGNVVYNPYYIDYVIAPYDSLRESVTCGFVNTLVDRDGYVRQAMVCLEHEGERVYSLATQVYKSYLERQGMEAVLPETFGQNNRFYFTYSGKAGGYSVVSMADVLDGTVDAGIFRDAVVLVGAYAIGMQDSYTPAVSHDMQMYGVEIHANIVEALLEGKTQTPFSPVLYALGAGLISVLMFLFLRKINMLFATGILTFSSIFAIVFTRVMYCQGKIVPVVLPPVVFVILYLERMAEGYLTEILRRRRVVHVFKQYVAPQVVDKVSRDKDFKLVLGGENRHIAVLFVDIRGFTTMSESLRPEEVVEILNEYLKHATQAIFQHGGTLDKFVGDAAMAVFNAPFALDDYIYRAVCTAWDLQAGADALSARFKKQFGESVAFGIGIHCGNAVVGNIGCEFRMDYTAIGDTVNTAARLESSAKRGQILISEQVYEAVKDRISATPIGEIPLKGKSQGVFVYQLDGTEGGA